MDKIYVAVVAEFDTNGKIRPLEVVWEDGQRYEITHIHDVGRVASTKAGGTGYRYIVTIEGQQKTFG